MARDHLPIRFRVAVMQYIGVGMKGRSHAMAAELPDRGKVARRDMVLNNRPNVLVVATGQDELTRRDPAIVRGL